MLQKLAGNVLKTMLQTVEQEICALNSVKAQEQIRIGRGGTLLNRKQCLEMIADTLPLIKELLLWCTKSHDVLLLTSTQSQITMKKTVWDSVLPKFFQF
jgi:hypothetical protein